MMCQGSAGVRQGLLHVPDQYGEDEEAGEEGILILILILIDHAQVGCVEVQVPPEIDNSVPDND